MLSNQLWDISFGLFHYFFLSFRDLLFLPSNFTLGADLDQSSPDHLSFLLSLWGLSSFDLRIIIPSHEEWFIVLMTTLINTLCMLVKTSWGLFFSERELPIQQFLTLGYSQREVRGTLIYHEKPKVHCWYLLLIFTLYSLGAFLAWLITLCSYFLAQRAYRSLSLIFSGIFFLHLEGLSSLTFERLFLYARICFLLFS